MKSGLVSVVLPVYGVERYLDRCINSVINQTYSNLEIILVDDGSRDNCPQMCDLWAQKDNRIKVIHKNNEGLGMARNTGIEHATGEFICFFDSDDYIALDTIEKSYDTAKREHAQIVVFGFHKVNAEGAVVESMIPTPSKNLYCDKAVQEQFLPGLLASDPETGEDFHLHMSAWNSLFSMDLISKNNWRFVSERQIVSEDVYSLLSLYAHVRRVAVMEEAFYYYCENETSLTRTYRPERFERIKHFYAESIKLSQELRYPDSIACRLARVMVSFTIAALKQEAVSERSIAQKRESIKKIVTDPLFLSALKAGRSPADGLARRILFFGIEHKLYMLCYLLCKAKQ